jgi:hypothetical protein
LKLVRDCIHGGVNRPNEKGNKDKNGCAYDLQPQSLAGLSNSCGSYRKNFGAESARARNAHGRKREKNE